MKQRLLALSLVTPLFVFACSSEYGGEGQGAEGEIEASLENALDRGARTLVPTDDKARTLCRDEINRTYCSDASAAPAIAACVAKVVRANGRAACGAGGANCVRIESGNLTCVDGRAAYPTAASCEAPYDANCMFYSACLEPSRACGESGYALGYGERYCYAFKNNSNFSAAGRAWRDSTMKCLQEHLVTFVSGTTTGASCTKVLDTAFDSHPACYTQPGQSICDLPISDSLQVLRTIRAQDLFTARSARQVSSVIATCIGSLGKRLLGLPRLPQAAPAIKSTRGLPSNAEARDEVQARYDFWKSVEKDFAQDAR